MKFIHLSDLHLGKRVNEFSMIEDQRYILKQIMEIVDREKPDAVLIAGDVYDKSVPSEEAMQLWDDFLIGFVERQLPVYVVSGNHDSAVRLSEHGRIVNAIGIHLAPAYEGSIESYSLEDEDGRVNIYLMPFVKPSMVRHYFPEEEISTYTDACRVAINHMQVNTKERNILIAHQFVTGAKTCDSEETMVGGLDNVDASVFDCFDYVALGHLHGKQHMGREGVRYCGTPLKYSASERNQKKSVTIVELGKKGDLIISEADLVPLRDLRELKGSFADLMKAENYMGTATEDYIYVKLTEEDPVYEALDRLRTVYPNIMHLEYDNARSKESSPVETVENLESKSPLELFEEFYELQNNQPMSEDQKALSVELLKSIEEVGV